MANLEYELGNFKSLELIEIGNLKSIKQLGHKNCKYSNNIKIEGK